MIVNLQFHLIEKHIRTIINSFGDKSNFFPFIIETSLHFRITNYYIIYLLGINILIIK